MSVGMTSHSACTTHGSHFAAAALTVSDPIRWRDQAPDTAWGITALSHCNPILAQQPQPEEQGKQDDEEEQRKEDDEEEEWFD